MSKGVLVLVLAIGVIAGCEPNEISLYVEHVKQQPDAPECTVTESDEYTPYGLLDIAFRSPYNGYYLVTNQMMAREDYGNGIAEPNGINIDGMETYVRTFTGELVSATTYYEYEIFVEAENSQVAFATMIPFDLVVQLLAQGNCPSLDSGEWGIGTTDGFWLGTYYAVVRFIGHSHGGYDVMTPEFSFPIDVCCGCLVEWSNCTDECTAYCEEPEEHGMCQPGVFNGGAEYDCRGLFYNPGATWPAEPGEVCGDPDPTVCDCSDCDVAL